MDSFVFWMTILLHFSFCILSSCSSGYVFQYVTKAGIFFVLNAFLLIWIKVAVSLKTWAKLASLMCCGLYSAVIYLRFFTWAIASSAVGFFSMIFPVTIKDCVPVLVHFGQDFFWKFKMLSSTFFLEKRINRNCLRYVDFAAPCLL